MRNKTDIFNMLDDDGRLDIDTLDQNLNIDEEDNLLEEDKDLSPDIKEDNTSEIKEEISEETDEEQVIPEEDTQEIEEDPTVEVKLNGNPIALFAKQWKEEGKLSSDLEVGDNFTSEELDAALYDFAYNTNVKAQIKTSVEEAFMEEHGIDASALETAKLFHYGVSDMDLKELNLYTDLSMVRLDKDDDSYEEAVRVMANNYYLDKGFDESEVERFVEMDLAEVDLGGRLKKYTDHFGEKAFSKKGEIDKSAEAERRREVKEKDASRKRVTKLLDSGEISGTKYTKKQMDFAKKAMSDKSEVYTDKNGKSYRVTLERKKILEHRDDPEKYLKARIDFLLGYNALKVNNASREAGKKELLNGLKDMISVNVSGGRNIKSEKALNHGGEERIL